MWCFAVLSVARFPASIAAPRIDVHASFLFQDISNRPSKKQIQEALQQAALELSGKTAADEAPLEASVKAADAPAAAGEAPVEASVKAADAPAAVSASEGVADDLGELSSISDKDMDFERLLGEVHDEDALSTDSEMRGPAAGSSKDGVRQPLQGYTTGSGFIL